MSSSCIFDKSEVCIDFLSDDEFQEASKIVRKLQDETATLLRKVTPETCQHLEGLIETVEKSYDKSRKARIAGALATIAGSTLAIVGFGLSFVTLGASLGLTASGATLAAAGGVIIGGAEIGYLAVAKKKLKETEMAFRKYNEEMHKIEADCRDFSDHLESLASKHPIFCKEHILRLLKLTWNSTEPALKTLYFGYKLLDGATDMGRNAVTISNTVRAGSHTVYTGLGTFGRAFSIASVVLDIVFIPIDLAVLVKSAHDVHRYKSGRGKSNSAAAASIRSVLTQLEEKEKGFERARNQWTVANYPIRGA